MAPTWDYDVIDAHLCTVLSQYGVIKGQLIQKYEDDCDEILHEPCVETAPGNANDVYESLQAQNKSLRERSERQRALLGEFKRAKRELDDEKRDVKLLIKMLRGRFQSRTPASYPSTTPHKVERDQMLSDDIQIPELGETSPAELPTLKPDTSIVQAEASMALCDTITHDDPQEDTLPPLEPAAGVSIAGGSIQQPEHVPPFIEAAAPEDTPTARRSPTPPHLHNPPGKRKQPPKPSLPPNGGKRAKTSRLSTGPPLTDRTISFDEVYMDGKAEYQHKIVCFEGHNYIMKCEEHQVHFKAGKPITAAAKHLDSSVHNNQGRDHKNAVTKLGYLVTGCTPELIQKHNTLVEEAYANGYRPMRPKAKVRIDKPPKNLTASDNILQLATPHEAAFTAAHGKDTSKFNSPSSTSIQGAVNPIQPIAGELYYGSAKPANPGAKPKKFIVMVLPWKQLPPLDERMAPTLGQSPLLKEAQRKTCYVYDQDGIVGWMPGYEDNGPHVKKRWFPVLWFEKKPPDSYGWLRAGELSPYVCNGWASKASTESVARALRSRGIARTFFEGSNLQTPTLDDSRHGNCEASPMGSEPMDLDCSSSEDESPLMETRRPGLLAAQGQPTDPIPLDLEGVTQLIPTDESTIRPGSPVLRGEAGRWVIPGETDSSRRIDSPVISAECVTGMTAAALLSHQAIVGSVPAASAVPATNPAALEKTGFALDERLRSTASPSTTRADSADRSGSEARSAQLTPASSVDKFPVSETAPAPANGAPNAPKRMKGGPSSAKNAWSVWAYANGDEEMHHYQQPVKLIGSQDGIARAVAAEGPNIVIDAREVRKIDVDETYPGDGKCAVTMHLGSTTKRLVMASATGRFQLFAVMFKRWFGKFMLKGNCDDDIGPLKGGPTVQHGRTSLQGQGMGEARDTSEKKV